MRTILASVILFLLSGCSAMQSTPWDWLDEPEEIRWIDVTINGYGYDVSFSVPDHPEDWGQHIQAWPEFEKGEVSRLLEAPPEFPRGYTPWVRYYWDTWWGGFFKESSYDFSFEISYERCEGNCNFSNLNPNDWIQWRTSDWRKRYSMPLMKSDEPAKEFFSRFEIRSLTNANSFVFIFENSPMTVADSVSYLVPVNENHYLDFEFFVSKLRFGLREEPEWNQRRWQLVREIMDTVTITPDPWGELAN